VQLLRQAPKPGPETHRGAGRFICDSCVELCNEVIHDEDGPSAPVASYRTHPTKRTRSWLVPQPLQGARLHDVARRQILGIANFSVDALRFPTARRKRSRDLAPAARQGPEPARRSAGSLLFSAGFSHRPLGRTLVFATEVVVQLAERFAVEQRLPVLANHRLLSTTRSRPSSERSIRSTRLKGAGDERRAVPSSASVTSNLGGGG